MRKIDPLAVGGEAFSWVTLLGSKLTGLGVRRTAGPDIYIASDYSSSSDKCTHHLVGVLFADLRQSQDWQASRLQIRRKYLADGRRMAFKNLNDGARRAALVPFLEAAELLSGICVVLAIDKRVQDFGGFPGIHEGMEKRGMLKTRWKKQSFKKMIDITHFISALISILCREGQNAFWISDRDDCFASDIHSQDTKRMMEIFTSMHVPFSMGTLGVGTTELDEGDRFEEDLAAIPDLAVGALYEIASGLSRDFGAIPKNNAPLSALSPKSEVITNWFFNSGTNLRKVFCFVQPGPDGAIQLGTLNLK